MFKVQMSEDRVQNHGFVEDEIRPEDFVFGERKIIQNPLQMDGQWDKWLPVDELQNRNGLETSNCTNYGTLNCLEMLFYRLFGELKNFSERYTGVLTGTTKTGNSPHRVIEKIRQEIGVIPESELPFSDDINEWEEYYSPNPMRTKYIRMGQEFLRQYRIRHEWVFTNGRSIEEKKKLLKAALIVSPVGVSVVAWKKRNGLYWKNVGERDGHWVTLYGYGVDEQGREYWKIFDHYNNTKKRLEIDYDFGFAKRYFLERKPVQTKGNWLQDLIARILQFFGLIRV